MAISMNKPTQAQKDIVNKIISMGQQLSMSDQIIMAAVNFANAESEFDPLAKCPTQKTIK